MNPQQPISPWHTIILLCAIGALVGLGILANVDGTNILGYELRFPNKEDFSPTQRRTVNMQRLLQDYHEIDLRDKEVETIDTTSTDTIKLVDNKEEEIEEVIPFRALQWDTLKPHPLANFFELLLQRPKKVVRILHYGDSQIEGDRISSRLRHRLQSDFGGRGPGLQSFTPLVTSYSIGSKASSHWKRYPGFGRKDSTITHNLYGPLISLSRYSAPDSNDIPWIEITPSRVGYANVRTFDRLKIYFGNVTDSVQLEFLFADSILETYVITPSTPSPLTVNVPRGTKKTQIFFYGPSADWYGYSAESTSGIILDNIPLRGASGNFFSAIPTEHFTRHFAKDEVRLIILQFGGNVVPYIKDEEAAMNYGKRMAQEIRIFQKRFPQADFIFIGPSDMGTKVRTRMESFPNLVYVVNALKKAAFDTGIAYWDIYEAMGGHNSMAQWVESDPPLAAPDYVHFTVAGAKLVAEWLTQAIDEALIEWNKSTSHAENSIDNEE
jgi:lysophospholipase L1-like esterase